MSTKLSHALLAAGCALSLLLATGCQREAEVEVPPDSPAETTVEEPEAADALGRTVAPAVEDSSQSAGDDGPGAGGGYGE
ncbi:MAG TPA: hypothetical protein VK002_15420 [Rubricoccaceae bacterium]|nr:hypothetical protein [Rubricoccaceae bacterium]